MSPKKAVKKATEKPEQPKEQKKPEMWDFIIVGGGPAGLSAAIYAARFRLKTLVLSKQLGGTVMFTHMIENYPGFGSITGMDLANKFVEHAKSYGVPIREEEVIGVAKRTDGFAVQTANATYNAKSLLFATGTEHRKLGVPGEEQFKNKGVSYCAVCDAPVYKDKIVGVVGGSDSAAKEALFLAKYAKKVYIIYRREKIRAEPVTAMQVENEKKIEIIINSVVTEIKGADFVTSATIEDVNSKKKRAIALDGLFIEIGGIPGSELAKRLGAALNEKGEIVTDRAAQTNVPGIFAAGDVAANEWKQAITAAADGAMSVLSAYKFVRQATVA